jgi:hypothetical protein
VWSSLFALDGASDTVAGLRLGASRWTDAGTLSLAYEFAQHEPDNAGGDYATLNQHNLRTNWDFALGADWFCALRADFYFGDEQDATSAGVWLQRRF